MLRTRRILVALGSLLLLAPAVGGGEEEGGPSIWDGFRAVDLEGRVWTREALAGKVVLLDFWATWCAPCAAELPYLKRAYQRFRPQGDFEILGVSLDQGSRGALRSWLWRQEVSWPQIHDGRGTAGPLARRFRVDRVPRTILVDADGRVVATDLSGQALLAVLAAHFARGESGSFSADRPEATGSSPSAAPRGPRSGARRPPPRTGPG